MKRILLGLLTTGSVAGVAIFATNAFFSDVETSVGNTFTAGKLDLKVDSTQHYNGNVCQLVGQNYQWVGTNPYPVEGTPCTGSWTLDTLAGKKFFDFADVKPGDNGENTISLHVDNNPAWACMRINNIVDNGELDEKTNFRIWADVCTSNTDFPNARVGDNIYQPACDNSITSGTLPAPLVNNTWALADSTVNVFSPTPGPLNPTPIYYVGMSWDIPSSVGNEIQGDSYSADVSFYTEQERNNPNFTCGLWPTPVPPTPTVPPTPPA